MRALEFIIEAIDGHKANRAEFVKKQMGAQFQGLPGFDDIDTFIEKVAEIDPSLKGIYMPWIAKLAIKSPDQNRTEDFYRLADDLKNFEQFKPRLEKKDINAYKSFTELAQAIEPFLKPKKKTAADRKAEKEMEKIATLKGEIVTVYQGSEGWVRVPMSKAASCYLGQNTKWCTAATQSNNMFDHYNKSDRLFVIYDKATKQRFQLHIDSGQFMNIKDQGEDVNNIPQWARKPIVTWYKENNPNLSLKQIMFLAKWTDRDTDLSTGTDHEDVINLMKQYGVL